MSDDQRTLEIFGRQIGRRAVLRGGVLGGAGLATAALIGCGDDEEEDETASTAPTASTGGTGGDDSTTDDTATTTDADSGQRFPEVLPEPPGQPKAGGEFRVAVTWDTSTMDPTQSAAGGTITIPNTVYNRLLGFRRGAGRDPAKLELVPELASSWEQSPDGLDYTFTIRDDIKWQNIAPLNGRKFVAEDLKFAFDRYATEGVHKSYWLDLNNIEAVDDHTLKISINRPAPDFIIPLASRLQTIFPRELVDSGEIEDKAIGTGPMILKEALQSDKVTFDKNPDYWQSDVLLDSMVYRVMTDGAARLAAFRAGQLEFAYSLANTIRDVEALLDSNPDVQIRQNPVTQSTFTFTFNLENPKWQDERVRQALSLGMDRETMVQVLYDGFGKALPIIPWFMVHDQEPTFESGGLGPWWQFNQDEARKLLQAAGAEDLTFDMTFYNYSDVGNSRPNEILIDLYRQIGVNMNADRVDYTEFNSQLIGRTAEDMLDGWQSPGFAPDNFFFNQVHSESPGNRHRINDPDIDGWAEKQQVELDPEVRKEYHRRIWDRVLDKAYRVEKPTGASFEQYQPWVRGIQFGGVLGTNSYYYEWGQQIAKAWLDK